jgi:integrase
MARPRRRPEIQKLPTRVDADQWKTKIEHDLLAGTYSDPQLGRTLFRDWCDQWLRAQIGIKPPTRNLYQSLLRNHVLPTFGNRPLVSILPQDLRQWVGEIADRLSPVTTRKCYTLLSACLNASVDDGLIPKSPCRGVDLLRIDKPEQHYLTPEQIDALAGTVPDPYRALVLTAAYTGLRWGELAALRGCPTSNF